MTGRVTIRVGADAGTMRGRWLGARLRELRDAAGLTGVEVAERMGRSASTLSRWETGSLIPRVPDVHFMLGIYGVRRANRDALLRQTKDAREREDWETNVSVEIADYAWLERRAWKVESFQDSVVPGLLQTPDYTRVLLRAVDPAVTTAWIERAVAVRLARQQRLTGEDPLRLAVVIEEMALRRPIGPPELMRAQLTHIIELSRLANVEIRVLPFAAGAHASLAGAFAILRLRDEQDLASLETGGPDVYLEDVEPFALTLRRLVKSALAPRKSVAMIGAIRRETT